MLKGSDKVGTFGHGYTYSGHPVAAAIAIEAQKIYRERDMLGHVRRHLGPFQKAMASMLEEDLVGEHRGVGLVAGLELVKDKKTKAPFAPVGKIGKLVTVKAQERGLICRAIGDTIAICPPLVIEADQVEELARRLRLALRDAAAEARKDGML
jgi:4-aminobutyrate--pyruvate transaminase